METHDQGESRVGRGQPMFERDVDAIRTQLCHPATIVQRSFTPSTRDTDLRHCRREEHGRDDQ